MDLSSCDTLREATRNCPVVLVTATDAEAEFLCAALLRPEKHVLATKTIYVGEIETQPYGESPGVTATAAEDGPPPPDGPSPPAAPQAASVAVSTVRVVLAVSGCDKANVAHVLACLLQAMTPRPLLVLQVGIAGAFPSAGPGPGASVGDLIVATRETYSDAGGSSPLGWYTAAELGLPIARVNGVETGGVFSLDVGLCLSVAEIISEIEWSDIIQDDGGPTLENVAWPMGVGRPGAVPGVLMGPCVTSSRVTGIRSEAEALAQRWSALAESMEGAAAAHICALYGAPFMEIRGISNLVGDREREMWRVEHAARVAGRAALAVVARLDRLSLVSAGRAGAGAPGGMVGTAGYASGGPSGFD